MRNLLTVAGSATLLLLLTGCPPTYPKCNDDDHCKEKGEVCVQGQCQECATDQHCKEGFICEANRCMPKPECTPGGNECGEGQKCQGGKCVTAECTQDGDCAAGRCRAGKCDTTCSQDTDCPDGQGCQDGTCVVGAQAGRASAEGCNWDPIRFDFNDAQLTPEARSRLEKIAECLKIEGVKTLRLEGHADERGTEEYNLQLSNRRAESVKRYLETLGVAPGALDTVGYGETRPAASGSDESAWATNRRVELGRR